MSTYPYGQPLEDQLSFLASRLSALRKFNRQFPGLSPSHIGALGGTLSFDSSQLEKLKELLGQDHWVPSKGLLQKQVGEVCVYVTLP
jgi:hypothetical protein